MKVFSGEQLQAFGKALVLMQAAAQDAGIPVLGVVIADADFETLTDSMDIRVSGWRATSLRRNPWTVRAVPVWSLSDLREEWNVC